MNQAHIKRALEVMIRDKRLHELLAFVGDPEEGSAVARWVGREISPRPLRVLVRPELNDDWLSVFDLVTTDTVTVLCTAHPELVPHEIMGRCLQFHLEEE